MPKRRVHGPTAFLVTLGSVVCFLGLLVLLAIPAAVRMDEKAAEDGAGPRAKSRAAGVRQQAMIAIGTGGGLMLLGFALGWRKARRGRSE